MTVEEMIEALNLMPPDAIIFSYNGEYASWDAIRTPIAITIKQAKKFCDNPWVIDDLPKRTTHIVSI